MITCCLFPTAPFVKKENLVQGLRLLKDFRAYQTVILLVKFERNIYRSYRILEDDGVEMNFPEYETAMSQDMEDAYYDAGQWYF